MRTHHGRSRRSWLGSLMAAAMLLLGAGTYTVTAAVPARADTGGYPYANAVDCSAQYGASSWCINGYWISGYGYGYRNCTDFVAWKVATLGVPSSRYTGLGNAKDWPTNAPSKGLTVNVTPAVGAAAVSTSGSYGHVAFISAYNGSTGNVTVQEYNHAWNGSYGTRSGTLSGLGFSKVIHFEAYETSGGGSGPDSLLWKLRNANSGGSASTSFYYGAPTDTPIVGDWDGNRTVTPGIVRTGGELLWKLRNSNSSGGAATAFYYGPPTAVAVAGNWDSRGTTTVGVVRRDDGTDELLWQLRNADGDGSPSLVFHYGPLTAIPIVGDWDGNGTVTPGIVRRDDGSGELLWELRNSNDAGPADVIFHYGPVTAMPIAGNWDGVGTTTAGIVRKDDGSELLWELRDANGGGPATAIFHYGAVTDTPVVGDWDGNGTVTPGIVRR